jgi:hypothetical protein
MSPRVRFTWVVVQLAAIGLGIFAGVRLFHWAS